MPLDGLDRQRDVLVLAVRLDRTAEESQQEGEDRRSAVNARTRD